MTEKQNSREMIRQSNKEMGEIYKGGLDELQRIRFKIKVAWVIMLIAITPPVILSVLALGLIGLKYTHDIFMYFF